MSTSEAAQQANRSGLDPQRLVIGFYILAVVVVGLFVERLVGLAWGRLGWRDPEVVEGVGIHLTTVIGFVVAAAGAGGAWANSKVRTLSYEVASELMKVTWPSWAETRVSTFAVIVASLISAVILFGIDTAAYKVMVDWLPILWGKL